MPTFPRFLLDRDLTHPGEYALGPQESRHAHVLRLDVGDPVMVFDGKGRYAEAAIAVAGKDGTSILVDVIATEDRLPLTLTLATAIPKGKRWQALVEKCTELGVDCIAPMTTERSVCRGEGDVDKWRRWTIEAAKQSRRAFLPEIRKPVPFAEMLDHAGGDGSFLLYADPGGDNPANYRERLLGLTRVVAVIGPEGGFSDNETALLAGAGGKPVRLSPFILRIETAAATICAMLRETF